MKKILITGSDGFIGKNLIATLKTCDEFDILAYDLQNEEQLEFFIEKCDAVIHLAGINRPKTNDDYSLNIDFTNKLIGLLRKKARTVPFIFSSSIQATLDNSYGISKNESELSIINWAKEVGSSAYIFRLPNIFGKWCKPNYNSVVATFCHNIANDIPITIANANKIIPLIYIDDVVSAIIDALYNKIDIQNYFCEVKPIYEITIAELANRLQGFKQSRTDLMMPSFLDPLNQKLYATYVSYLPKDSFAYPLISRKDERGLLAEFIKSNQFGQIFVSKTLPGITRGSHWHNTKVEKFLVLSGEAVITFRQIHTENVLEYRVSGEKLEVLDIPTGYTHSITNIGTTECITIFWSSQVFDPEKPDTYFLEV